MKHSREAGSMSSRGAHIVRRPPQIRSVFSGFLSIPVDNLAPAAGDGFRLWSQLPAGSGQAAQESCGLRALDVSTLMWNVARSHLRSRR
ncbi:MAG: hypothetical protein QGF59_02630, partial [Pirellulaceae bacterium]|nr:hypothetical protein [Pirellulaceae bacterium]